MAGTSDIAAEGDEVGLAEVDGAVGPDVADGDLDGGVVLGGDDSVSVVAFPRQVDVGEFVLIVYGALHLRFQISLSSCFHWLQIILILL